MNRVAICDDNPRHLRDLRERVAALLNCTEDSLFTTEAAEEIMEQMRTSAPFDILLLDIALEGEDGISLARHINVLSPVSQIIFVTSYLTFAPDAYMAEHVYFVLKTQMDEKLPLALARAEKKLHRLKNESIAVKVDGTTQVLLQSDIVYMEQVLRKSLIHCDGYTLETSEKPDALLQRLNPAVFVQCHKSFVVNLRWVRQYKRQGFTLEGDVEVPISRRYVEAAKLAFFNYLGH